MNWRCLISLLSAAVLLTSGCASLNHMNSKQKIPEACLTTCWRLQVTPTKYLLTVNISKQTVSLFENGAFVKKYPCSTSRFGIGQQENSNCTPLGLHRIAEKIGDGEPAGTIFKSREVVGNVSELGVKAGRITTRIMWLEGLEPGFNQGGNVDTHNRYIYIHGTGDQQSIGRPDSHGCIHLADVDLILLFDLLPSGTLVWIGES
jgi:L,D-transpeptidase catalytic domain